MSRRAAGRTARGCVALAATVTVVALTAPVAALQAALAQVEPAAARQTERELLPRLDSLRPLLERATADLEAFERASEERARLSAQRGMTTDTLRVGLVRVIVPEAQARTAGELFGEVWAEHYAGFVGHSPALERSTFTFQWTNEPAPIFVAPGPASNLEIERWTTRARVQERIRDAIAAVLRNDLGRDRPIARWVSGDAFQAHERERIYRVMATTMSQAVRRCLEGISDACGAALGLGIGDDALEAWYTPEERRDLVMRSGTPVASERDGRSCVEDRRIEACDRLLRTDRRRWAPLPSTVRASLLRFALDTGGSGAWVRLLEQPEASAEEALSHASGLGTGELLGKWRAWIVAGRPETYAGQGARSLLAAFWILFFATLATRSTRWRLQ